ncbi:hypothetical protein CS8_023840 [Cupriavidus sp. 8B]
MDIASTTPQRKQAVQEGDKAAGRRHPSREILLAGDSGYGNGKIRTVTSLAPSSAARRKCRAFGAERTIAPDTSTR